MRQDTVRRPLPGFAVCVIAGTWAGLAWAPPPNLLLACAAVLWALSAALLPREKAARTPGAGRPRVGTGAAAVFACAAFLACAGASRRAGHEGGAWLPDAGTRIELTGIVASDPEVLPAGGDRAQWRFPLRVESAEAAGPLPVPRGARATVRVYGPGGYGGPAYGERWAVAGTVIEAGFRSGPRPARAPAGKAVRAGFVRSRRLSAGQGWRAAELCYAARRSAAAQLARGIGDRPEVAGLVRALLLGYRGELPRQARDVAVASGTLHIFAISGLHVGVIAGMIVFVLRTLGVPRVYWVLFIAPLLAAYTFATGMKASAVRACVMATIFWAAPFAGRRADSFSALALAAVAILAAAPAQLFDIGFVCSFVVVTGLIVLYPRLHAPWTRLLAPDPFRVVPERAAARGLRRAASYAASLWSLSVAAWVTSAPLTAYYFGRFVPGAIVSNLVVIPLAFLMVVAACLSLVLGPIAPWLGITFNNANIALVAALMRSLAAVTAIPGAHLRIAPPPAAAVWLWYAVLALVLMAHDRRNRRAAPGNDRDPRAGATSELPARAGMID